MTQFNFTPIKFNYQDSFMKKVDSLNKSFKKSLDLTLSCAIAELDDKIYQSIEDAISDESNKLKTIYTGLMNKIDNILSANIK